MQWSLIRALALGALVQTVTAIPANGKGHNLKVVKSTQYGDDTIDWVVKESQGDIASPPPAPPAESRAGDGGRPTKQPTLEELTKAPALNGPPGTVPILRTKKDLPPKRLPSEADNNRTSTAGEVSAQAGSAGVHWYASSAQRQRNHGSGAMINIYNTYTDNNNDFSLLQTAVTVDSAPQAGGGTQGQTVEAGLMHFENLVSGGPFLFTYFTTNGYTRSGDNLGGYNQFQRGWVQHDDSVFPGMHLNPVSTVGGGQYEFKLEYRLFQGNWWLYVLDRYIGYYPGWVFSQGGVDAGRTLQSGSDVVLWYGEIYNSPEYVTTTDMGSGHFPEDGFGKAAYIRGIYVIDTGDNAYQYSPNTGNVISDANRYRLQSHWVSGEGSWGSYMYLGGPGAGGVIGG